MENIFFCSYPKSTNHKIILTKKDNIGICDLSSDCTKLNFSISKNKFNVDKIFNYNYYINNLEKFTCINYINSNIVLLSNVLNYDMILFFLTIILFFILNFYLKK